MDHTTTTDSLGIVTLASNAFHRGHLTEAQLNAITDCADDFTRVLSLANKCRQVTGQGLRLDDIPSPATLRQCMEAADFSGALAEVARIKAQMEALFAAARQRLASAGAVLAADG